MGWELELTDAVYNNDVDLVRQYLQSKEVKKSLGERQVGIVTIQYEKPLKATYSYGAEVGDDQTWNTLANFLKAILL